MDQSKGSEKVAGLNVKFFTEIPAKELVFSICTLVASNENYVRQIESFRKFGFSEKNSEFIAIDNRSKNFFDGFSGLRAVFPHCSGRYILYVHDDIELIEDDAKKLKDTLDALTLRDPCWMVAGNAGHRPGKFVRSDGLIRHLSDPHGDSRDAISPVLVQAVDENFIVLRADAMVFPSRDIGGFHFFAADLSLQAELAGGTTYVIPFFLRHHSAGKVGPDFKKCMSTFKTKYSRIFRGRVIRTCAARVPCGLSGQMQMLWGLGTAKLARMMSALRCVALRQ